MNKPICGICLSRNRGHQNALLAGLMKAKNYCDITISIDCDGQDDINCMNKMVSEYQNGAETSPKVRPFIYLILTGFYRFPAVFLTRALSHL